jgi:CheY-like chemotaxis protein
MQSNHDQASDGVRRILVVDDNGATHQDFRKILIKRASVLDDMEAVLFGDEAPVETFTQYEIDSAYQGSDGAAMVEKAVAEGRPYDLAIVDLRMPPGWDGIETIATIWKLDPELQVILCAAYLGQTPAEVVMKLQRSQGLTILQKPFESSHVLRLAGDMTAQCRALRQSGSASHAHAAVLSHA